MLWDICGRDTADTFTGQVYKSLETLPHNLHYLTPILAGGKEEVNIFIFVLLLLLLFSSKEQERIVLLILQNSTKAGRMQGSIELIHTRKLQ